MIKKLRAKFVLLSMSALFVLLLLLITGMNAVNYSSVVGDADEILSLISTNEGRFPEFDGSHAPPLPGNMSPELPYESRYFSVLLSHDGTVLQTDTSRIASVDADSAIEYAERVVRRGKERAFTGSYRYLVSLQNGNVRITFLDCSRQLNSFYTFLFASISISLLGFAAVFCVIFFCAGRIIRPIAEAHEKQKRFITDAGHEIKTPLTIINANADILEMEFGENESIDDIKSQAARLTRLTNDLIMLSRMEEAGGNIRKFDFSLSDTVLDTVAPFKALAEDRLFSFHIEPMLTLKGDASAISQLVSILLDNAFKYSPADGRVTLSLTRQNKYFCLSVYNSTAVRVNKKELPRIFDRFYRTDLSRNSSAGGHGIGLSVAAAITAAHSGKIFATAPDENSFNITVLLNA